MPQTKQLNYLMIWYDITACIEWSLYTIILICCLLRLRLHLGVIVLITNIFWNQSQEKDVYVSSNICLTCSRVSFNRCFILTYVSLLAHYEQKAWSKRPKDKFYSLIWRIRLCPRWWTVQRCVIDGWFIPFLFEATASESTSF